METEIRNTEKINEMLEILAQKKEELKQYKKQIKEESKKGSFLYLIRLLKKEIKNIKQKEISDKEKIEELKLYVETL